MSAFAMTPQQREFTQDVRTFAAERPRPIAENGTPGSVNRDLIKAMGSLGLLAKLFPGIGTREAAAMDLCLLRESLATQSTEAETALALQGLGSSPTLQSGRDEASSDGFPPSPQGTPSLPSRSPSPTLAW
jgi:acyl-CoA dehydrogenase